MTKKLSKAQKFKLNILKAFAVDEERQLQKSVWGAMIEDELPDEEEEVPALASRDVQSPVPVALPAAQTQALPAPAPVVEQPAQAFDQLQDEPVSQEPEAKPESQPEAEAAVSADESPKSE